MIQLSSSMRIEFYLIFLKVSPVRRRLDLQVIFVFPFSRLYLSMVTLKKCLSEELKNPSPYSLLSYTRYVHIMSKTASRPLYMASWMICYFAIAFRNHDIIVENCKNDDRSITACGLTVRNYKARVRVLVCMCTKRVLNSTFLQLI